MCGRYRFDGENKFISDIERQTGLPVTEVSEGAHLLLREHGFLRPYNDVPVLIEGSPGELELTAMYWQLIQPFSQRFESSYTNFNTRFESLEKKHNRGLLERQRCLLPTTCFFETRRDPEGQLVKPREAYRFFSRDGGILFMGGLYAVWRNPENRDDERLSCSVITMEPNEIVGEIHPRMPFLVPDPHCRLWVNRAGQEFEFAISLIKPFESELLVRERE